MCMGSGYRKLNQGDGYLFQRGSPFWNEATFWKKLSLHSCAGATQPRLPLR